MGSGAGQRIRCRRRHGDPTAAKLRSLAAWRFHPSAASRYGLSAAAARPGHAILPGHTNRVVDVSLSPDGKTLATASYDGSVRLWDAATHRQIGRTLTTGSGDGTVRFFAPSPAARPDELLARRLPAGRQHHRNPSLHPPDGVLTTLPISRTRNAGSHATPPACGVSNCGT
ncbi:WD40 repeat domain-containing protein [Streptomyces sp. MMG1533]|uniref:WD40 repeat domain-containing protein n=1 Tax=Streptomyces sp. MMG1533 TaxID=1415546 RepID=UPI00099E0F81|nr:WD40 repeat domain-containing protein [Streptomyces sp. MMG1533]